MAWGCPNILTQFHLSLPQPGAASHRHRPPLQHLLPRLWLHLPGCHLLQASLTHAFRHHQSGEGVSGPLGWAHWPHASLRLFVCGATTPGTNRVHCLEALRGRGRSWSSHTASAVSAGGSGLGAGCAAGPRLSVPAASMRWAAGGQAPCPGFHSGSALTSALLPEAVPMAPSPSLSRLLPVITQTSSSVILKATRPPSCHQVSFTAKLLKRVAHLPISTSFPLRSQPQRGEHPCLKYFIDLRETDVVPVQPLAAACTCPDRGSNPQPWVLAPC